MIKSHKNQIRPSDIAQVNHGLSLERFHGVLLVFAPPAKWSDLSLKCTSELERVLRPAMNHEEDAILVAPDRFTFTMLKLESFPAHIRVVLGDKAARQQAERIAGDPTQAQP